MTRLSTITLLLPIAFLFSCGGASTSSTPAPTGTYINVTGNWQFQIPVTPATSTTAPIEDLFGALSSSGNAVTATLRSQPLASPLCVAATTDLLATGTLDTSGNLTLTFPIAGGVGTLSANFTENSTHPILPGTYQVVGGACAQPAISMTFFEVLNVSGTYTGTMTAASLPNSTVTAVLNESTTPNSDGQYPLTGTITSTGGCNTTLIFSQGVVYGGEVQSFPFTVGLTPVGNFLASAEANSNQSLPIAILLALSACGGNTYEGTLNLQ